MSVMSVRIDDRKRNAIKAIALLEGKTTMGYNSLSSMLYNIKFSGISTRFPEDPIL